MANFASENESGVPEEVLAELVAANDGAAAAYGDDDWTARANATFRVHFGEHARSWFVTTGTAANVLALKAVCRPWDAVIAPATSHLHVDECGAAEQLGGLKLLLVEAIDGKLRPADVTAQLARVGDQHASQPRVVSVAQCTELGTVYSADELAALADVAHAHGLLLHVDGARLANAAVALGVDLRAACAGADVLSFGGTKTGLVGAEAVVFLRPGLGEGCAGARRRARPAGRARYIPACRNASLEGLGPPRCEPSRPTRVRRRAPRGRGGPPSVRRHPRSSSARTKRSGRPKLPDCSSSASGGLPSATAQEPPGSSSASTTTLSSPSASTTAPEVSPRRRSVGAPHGARRAARSRQSRAR